MKPFDVHCHLYDESFDKDRANVIERAKKVLSGIVNVGEGPESNKKVLELCKKYPDFIFPGLAIHPDQVWKLTDKQIVDEMSVILNLENLACIGECGLDYKWEEGEDPEKSKLRQRDVFILHIELAKKMDLPLNVHSRRATGAVVDMLKKHGARKVVLHGFSGTPEEMEKAVALGYKLTIGTGLFWKDNKESLYKLNNFPLSTFVLETDSPVLAPVKSERNVPENISLVVKEIAKIKNITEKEVIETTNKNVKELFRV